MTNEQKALKLEALADWFTDCKTLTLERLPVGLIETLREAAALLRLVVPRHDEQHDDQSRLAPASAIAPENLTHAAITETASDNDEWEERYHVAIAAINKWAQARIDKEACAFVNLLELDVHKALGALKPPDVVGTEPRLSSVCAPPPSARDYQVSLEGAPDFDLNHFGGGVERIERRGELLIFQFTNGGRLCVPGAVTYHAPERH